MTKKVAIIIERADTALGGAERSVFELAQAIGEIGYDVDILAAKGDGNAKGVKFICDHMPGKRVCHRSFAKGLKKYLSENRYDIVHSFLPFEFADIYQPRGGAYAEAILGNSASYENKFIESLKNATAFMNIRRRQLLAAEKKLCKNPKGPIVAAPSSYVARQFKSHYGLTDNRIVTIPNGVKTDRLPDIETASKLNMQIMSQLEIKQPEKAVFFLFAANNFRLKGLSCLLKAIRLAADNNPDDCSYLIIAGNDNSNTYLALAEKLKIRKKVIFIGAVSNIQNAFSITDVAVLPTFYDPSSRFILEALAANKPVITTSFNGACDLFVNDRHGKVIDRPQNIGALAEAVHYFSQKENIRNASQAIFDDNIRENISINRVAKQLDTLYKSLPAKHSKL